MLHYNTLYVVALNIVTVKQRGNSQMKKGWEAKSTDLFCVKNG